MNARLNACVCTSKSLEPPHLDFGAPGAWGLKKIVFVIIVIVCGHVGSSIFGKWQLAGDQFGDLFVDDKELLPQALFFEAECLLVALAA